MNCFKMPFFFFQDLKQIMSLKMIHCSNHWSQKIKPLVLFSVGLSEQLKNNLRNQMRRKIFLMRIILLFDFSFSKRPLTFEPMVKSFDAFFS